MAQSWTKQRVQDKIQALYKCEGRINSMFAQTKYGALYQAGCSYFGSWEKAVTAAGFRYSDVKIKERPIFWTEERVKEEVLKVYKSDGKINSNHAQTKHQALYGAAYKRFGSWKAAVNAVGLDYEILRKVRPSRAWSKQAVLAEIKRRLDEGLPLTTMLLLKEDYGLYNAAKRYFGSRGWKIALNLAGIDLSEMVPNLTWKKGKVIEEIHRLASLSIPLYGYYLVNNGHESLFAGGCKRFGSWKCAIEAAGFDYEKIRAVRRNYWTKEKVIAEIKDRKKYGAPLTHRLVHRTRADLVAAAITLFGRWSKAVEAAGFDYDKIKLVRHNYWTEGKILQEIRSLEKSGMRLNSQTVRRKRGDLFAAATVFFGTWSQAVEAAGINYLEHCMVWSTKAWLRKLTHADVARLEQRADKLTKLLDEKKKRRKK